MTPEQFWLQATDIYHIHHGKYRHAIITDEELRETVTEFIEDVIGLISLWSSSNAIGDSSECP